MKCALKSSMQVSFILYILCLILFKFSQRIKQRDTLTHTHRKRGMLQAVYFWKQGCACLPPFFPLLPPHPSALCLFVLRLLCLFPSSWAAAAAAAELANISLHFNTLLLPRPHTAIAYPSQSKKQQPSGRWKFFFAFSRCLAKSAKKKGKLFLHNEFLRIFHLYEPATVRSLWIDSCCLWIISIFYFSHFPRFRSPPPVGSKSHCARLTMQIAGKYLGLCLGKLHSSVATLAASTPPPFLHRY